MKKMIAVLAAVAALALAVAAPNANAGACRTVKCFNKQVSRLQAEVVELQTGVLQIANTLKCVQPVAVSRYPGYDYNGYAAATTALDFTESGDQVSTWMLGIPPGSCGSPATRSAARRASKSSPFGPFQALPDATLQKDRSTLGGGR